MSDDTIEIIDNTNFKLVTSGTTVAKVYSMDTLLNQRSLLNTRIQSVAARAASDTAFFNIRLSGVEDLIQRALDAGVVLPSGIVYP